MDENLDIDTSEVFQGLTAADAGVIKEKEQFVKLWCHECLRVFQDRLIDDADRAWFVTALAEQTREHFSLAYEQKVKPAGGLPLLFGSWIEDKAVPERRHYMEVDNAQTMSKAMEYFLDEYNAMTSKPMSLVLFQNAIEHVSRVARAAHRRRRLGPLESARRSGCASRSCSACAS